MNASKSELAAGAATPKKEASQILKEEIKEGLAVMERSSVHLFVSALSGGLDLGFSMFLMSVMLTLTRGHFSPTVVRILVASMYAVGFIFVVVGRSELFTEQTSLAVLPVLRGRATVRSLLRSWGIVYAANLLGAAAFAAMLSYIGPAMEIADRASFAEIAGRAVNHEGIVIFCSAVLAGWLMGLCSWTVTAGRETISQIVMVWIVTTTIGLGSLHHVVAGSTEVFTAAFAGAPITMGQIGTFLICTTLGNAVGGTVFVGLIKYGHASEG